MNQSARRTDHKPDMNEAEAVLGVLVSAEALQYRVLRNNIHHSC